MSRLTTQCLRSAEPRTRPYRLSDGRGLALQVMPNGTKAWRFRYRIDRREKMISLGLYPAVPIEAARRLRDEARDMLTRGTDPSVARRARKQLEAQTINAIVDRWLAKLEKDVGLGKLAFATLKPTRWLLTKYFVPRLADHALENESMVAIQAVRTCVRSTPRTCAACRVRR